MSSSTRIGATIGGYRILSLLGRGGMSVVYLAEHVHLGRKVALKVLAGPLTDDTGFRDRFERESQRAAHIDHPNIIPVYDAGMADGELYIAMRYVQGDDLKALIRREGPLPVSRALFLLEQAASALDAAHAQDLVHRDVKPANILVEAPTDRVYVTDFGVVKSTTTRGVTQTGLFIGTADYAAPEQIEGLHVDRRTDVYALGCVLVEALTGRPPFDKDAEVAVMHAHLTQPPPSVIAARPELPATVDRVVARAMAKRAEERYDSCGELVAAFRAALLQAPMASTGAHPAQPAPVQPAAAAEPAAPDPIAVATASPAADAGAASPRQRTTTGVPRSRPAWLVPLLSATAAAAVAAVVAVLVTRDGDGGQSQPSPPAATPGPAPAASPPEPAPAPAAEPPPPAVPPPPVEPPPAPPEPAVVEPPVGPEPPPPAPPETTAPPAPPEPAEPVPPVDITPSADALPVIVPAVIWRDCTQAAEPAPGAVATATCPQPEDSIRDFYPDVWEYSIYPSGRTLADAYASLFDAVPAAARVGPGAGRCDRTRWGGEGPWQHGPDRPGGQRFCYFDASGVVLVWTHEKLGQDNHLNVLGIAREAGTGHAELINWWSFWVHQIGRAQ